MFEAGHANAAPCSLREACARARLDRAGKRCPVRDLCDSEHRWVVKAAPAAPGASASRH